MLKIYLMKLPASVRRQFQEVGAKGGKKGGPARIAALSPERRSEIARMGGLAKAAKKKNGQQ